MDVRDLRYFIAVAEMGQFRRAAEHVGRTQPALTKCIRRLEEQLGAALFDRKGHRVLLTPVGRALLARARSISQALESAAREAAEIAHGTIGHIRVGTGSTTAACFLPGLVNHMIGAFPEVTFDVLVGLADHLRELLRDDALDLVISPIIPSDRREFATIVVGHDELVVAAAAGHRLAGRTVHIEDLVDQKWLLPPASVGSTQWLNDAFERRGMPRPKVQIQTSTVVLLRQVVARTELLTFISRRDFEDSADRRGLCEIRVPEIAHRRELGILFVKDRHLPAVAHRLLGLTKAAIADVEILHPQVETESPPVFRRSRKLRSGRKSLVPF